MTKEFITRLQAEAPTLQQGETSRINTADDNIAVVHSGDNSISKLLQPLIKEPQCSWIVPWSEGYKVTNIELKYDDQPEASPDHYKYTMSSDIRQAIADWGTRNENNAKLKALRVRLEEQAEAVQVRIKNGLASLHA